MKWPIFLVVLCIMSTIFTSGCVKNDDEQKMTMMEFMQDYDQMTDNQTKTIMTILKSFNQGDTVIIKDKVNNFAEEKHNNEVTTAVFFESFNSQSLTIEGDITDMYKKGDTIELRLHIINTTFQDFHPDTGEEWTIIYETFEEGWDTSKNTFIPIPQETLNRS
jgi:hypothetical protein